MDICYLTVSSPTLQFKNTLFGKLEGQEFTPEKEKLEIIQKHLAKLYSCEANKMMINRLEQALLKNQKISGADASFYFHELKEYELMEQGLTYTEAHKKALEYYEVSECSVYHPDVIKACPDEFNKYWRKAWGIT